MLPWPAHFVSFGLMAQIGYSCLITEEFLSTKFIWAGNSSLVAIPSWYFWHELSPLSISFTGNLVLSRHLIWLLQLSGYQLIKWLLRLIQYQPLWPRLLWLSTLPLQSGSINQKGTVRLRTSSSMIVGSLISLMSTICSYTISMEAPFCASLNILLQTLMGHLAHCFCFSTTRCSTGCGHASNLISPTLTGHYGIGFMLSLWNTGQSLMSAVSLYHLYAITNASLILAMLHLSLLRIYAMDQKRYLSCERLSQHSRKWDIIHDRRQLCKAVLFQNHIKNTLNTLTTLYGGSV